jgi:hypothetical protein
MSRFRSDKCHKSEDFHKLKDLANFNLAIKAVIDEHSRFTGVKEPARTITCLRFRR